MSKKIAKAVLMVIRNVAVLCLMLLVLDGVFYVAGFISSYGKFVINVMFQFSKNNIWALIVIFSLLIIGTVIAELVFDKLQKVSHKNSNQNSNHTM